MSNNVNQLCSKFEFTTIYGHWNIIIHPKLLLCLFLSLSSSATQSKYWLKILNIILEVTDFLRNFKIKQHKKKSKLENMKRKRQFQVWHEFFFRFSCFKFFGCFIFLYYLLRCCVVHLIKFVCSLVYLNFMLIITEAACNVSHIFHITQSFILCVLVQVRQHQHSSLGAWRTTREHQKNFSSVCCNYLL